MAILSQKKINRYFKKAREVSFTSDFPNRHLGAIAVYKGTILANGANICKTSPLQKHYNKSRKQYHPDGCLPNTNSLHAEINCLSKIQYLDIDFSKVSLFVYRETKRGEKVISKPCAACTKMIKEMGIKNIYYTTNGGWCMEVFD